MKPTVHRHGLALGRALRRLLISQSSWRLTWFGRAMVFLLAAMMFVVIHRDLYPFLAITHRESGEFLVVEGWVPGYGLRQARTLFMNGGYRQVLTCGCQVPDEWGGKSILNYAELGAEKMRKLGLPVNAVTPVPCGNWECDRTYHSALAVTQWFEKNGTLVHAIDVATLGPHARRSRLLFQKAFGGKVKVGVIALNGQEYDPSRWWQSSEGFREVIGEEIAYLYVRLFFFPRRAVEASYEKHHPYHLSAL